MTPDSIDDTIRPTRQQRFLELFTPVRDRLSAYCRAMTRDRDEAEDLASETVLVAFESLHKLQSDGAFISWIFTIATRLHNRHRRRSKFFGFFDHGHAESIRDRGTAPDVSAEIQMLYEALTKLPEKQREAVVLFEISDLSLEEIREIQGGTLSGVKSRVTRGREKLAELLGMPNGPVPDNKRPTQAPLSRSNSIQYFELHPSTDR